MPGKRGPAPSPQTGPLQSPRPRQREKRPRGSRMRMLWAAVMALGRRPCVAGEVVVAAGLGEGEGTVRGDRRGARHSDM